MGGYGAIALPFGKFHRFYLLKRLKKAPPLPFAWETYDSFPPPFRGSISAPACFITLNVKTSLKVYLMLTFRRTYFLFATVCNFLQWLGRWTRIYTSKHPGCSEVTVTWPAVRKLFYGSHNQGFGDSEEYHARLHLPGGQCRCIFSRNYNLLVHIPLKFTEHLTKNYI